MGIKTLIVWKRWHEIDFDSTVTRLCWAILSKVMISSEKNINLEHASNLFFSLVSHYECKTFEIRILLSKAEECKDPR